MVNVRPVIPAQIFRPGTQNPRMRNGYGDRVAIIGAFPCVSDKVVHVNSYYEALDKLNITPIVNDKYHEVEEGRVRNINALNPNKDYFDGARALKQIFREGSGENNVSEATIINISTPNGCDTDTEQTPVYNAELTFGQTEADQQSQSGGTRPNTDPNNIQIVRLDKLDYALERLKEEEYDMLFLAFTPTEAQIKKLIKFCKESEFKRRNPIGIIYGYGTEPLEYIDDTDTHGTSIVQTVVNTTKSKTIGQNITAILNQMDLFRTATYDENHHHTLYACIAQSFKLDYEEGWLSPMESAAYYCGVLAGVRVNQSMTDEVIPNVEKVNENLIYEKNSVYDGQATDGYKLVEAGVTMFRLRNRTTKEIVCINSTLPGKGKRMYDISHLRTAAYVIRRMDLREFFGEHENIITYDGILTKLTTIKTALMEAFSNILYDIEYNLVTHDNNCIDVFVKIYEYDVLLQEEIYVDEVVLQWQI